MILSRNCPIKVWSVRWRHILKTNYINKHKPFDKFVKSDIEYKKYKPSEHRIISKKHKDKEHIKIFNEFRWEVNTCQKCSWTRWWLQIHHIDKNHSNNDPYNLIKLCLECYCKEHEWENIHKLMLSRLNFITNSSNATADNN